MCITLKSAFQFNDTSSGYMHMGLILLMDACYIDRMHHYPFNHPPSW